MGLDINLNYEELISAIKGMPKRQIKQLKEDLMKILSDKEKEKDLSAFQELLLGGPVMDEEQFSTFQANRKHFNAWRTN